MNPACAQRKKFPHVNLDNSYLLFDEESNNILLKNNSGDVS